MSAALVRTTMFKVPDAHASIPYMIEQYRVMDATATKDGKPYFLQIRCGAALPDERAHGYNFVAQTTFASLDDMKYYDQDCQAHQNLKANIKSHVSGPPLIVYFFEGQPLPPAAA